MTEPRLVNIEVVEAQPGAPRVDDLYGLTGDLAHPVIAVEEADQAIVLAAREAVAPAVLVELRL